MGTFKSKFKTSKFLNLTAQTISLPCYPSLTRKDLKKIEQVIDRFSSIL